MTWRLGIRAKLFLVSLGLIAVSMAAADLLLTSKLDADLSERVEAELCVRLALVGRAVSSEQAALDDVARWDALADELGRYAEARVTIVRRDGTVIGDSEVALAALATVESHAERPEVLAALAHGRGTAVRTSATIGERMLYAAEPFVRAAPAALGDAPPAGGAESSGVVRLARALTQVDEAIARIHRLVALASGVALAFAVLMSTLAAQWLGRAVRSVTRTARRMAGGDLAARTRAVGGDEIAELGRGLDALAGSLSRALDELKSERDVLGGVLESMREGVMLVAHDGRVVLANPALCRMLGVEATAARGKTPLELARSTALERALATASAHGEASAEIELAGADARRLRAHVTALSRPERGLLVVLVDVTELRRLENVRKDFVANVSHELRTPVAALRSASETLRGAGLASPEAPEFLAIVERHAERLATLVQDLLDLSRIEARAFQPELVQVSLPPLVAAIEAAFRGEAESKGIALVVALPASLPEVRADPRALEQVLSNLIDNAVKYGSPGPVVVRAELGARTLRVSVSDSGPGIERHHLPRLFERFYRVDTGRSRELGGTGLGLAIVKHLMEAMGGSVAVTSEPGKGSTFTITLEQSPVASTP